MHDGRPIPALGVDGLTPLFDGVVEILGYGESFKQKVLSAAQVRDDEILLDIGCGTGTLLVLAQQQDVPALAFGIDIDLQILRIARRKFLRMDVGTDLLQAGAQCLPLSDTSIDVAVSSLIFHHLPTALKRAAIHEAYRVLKCGGRFLLADFGPSDSQLLKLLEPLGRMLRLAEIETLRDNRTGKLPLMLEEASFAVREAVPQFRSVSFLLATK